MDRWSRRQSPLHRRDPRAKLAVLLSALIVLATTHRHLEVTALVWLGVICAVAAAARLPVWGVLSRAAIVLPFSLIFAVISWLVGDTGRAAALLVKSYLSASGVLLLMGTTPVPQLLRAMEMLYVPRFLLMVGQFLYRYLFVISEEAQHMRIAAAARGASARLLLANGARFRAAAGALAVLFARSYGRAEEIHRAMLARGFQGHFQPLRTLEFQPLDAVFLMVGAPAPLVLRMAIEKVAQ